MTGKLEATLGEQGALYHRLGANGPVSSRQVLRDAEQTKQTSALQRMIRDKWESQTSLAQNPTKGRILWGPR